MNEAARQFHRLKFRLWYFSRIHPTLGRPLRRAAEQATRGFLSGYQRKMERMGTALFPADRYERPPDVPCQCVLLADGASADQRRGATQLLNHLRIPFHRASARDLEQLLDASGESPALVVAIRLPAADAAALLELSGRRRLHLVAFGAGAASSSDPRVAWLEGDPADLLPYRSGLRSSLSMKFLQAIRACEFPVVTGWLPPRVAMRVDDVAGDTCRAYVPAMIEAGWVPNLGLFMEDFKQHASDCAPFLAALDREQQVEVSPHAMTAYEFLFYNYKDGEPFPDEQFASMWAAARRQCEEWGLSVCPVLNAHFHAFSPNTYPLLSDAGVKYIFSELAPNGIGAEPGPRYLPSGDPLCTTGQLDGGGMYQIHSGDPTLCCNLADSTYDFLMHNDSGDVVAQAGRKIAERLALSLGTGFAAFATTHEYLLASLTRAQIAAILCEADRRLAEMPYRPAKVPLSEIGRACENHTSTVVRSVRRHDHGWTVDVTGRSAGEATLCVFGRGGVAEHAVPGFAGGCQVEVQGWA